MANDDFDINFDFDKEYDFDPKILSGEEGLDDDIDLSQFTDEELGLKPQEDGDPQEDIPEDDFDFDVSEFLDDDEETGDTFTDEELTDDVPDFAQKNRSFTSGGYGTTPEFPADAVPSNLDEEPPVEEEPELPPEEEPADQEDSQPDTEDDANRRRRERRKPKKEPKEKKPREKKPAKPNIFTKFLDLYFAPVLHKELLEEPKDPNAPRRRRKTKAQIFKEAYLPALVVCLSLILVLSFAIGSLTNAIKLHVFEKNAKESQLQSSLSAAQQAESESQIVLQQAQALAGEYNYEDAITAIDNFLSTVEDSTKFTEINALRAEYVEAQSQLVVYQDPSLIPNLSFHVLVHDMAKAKQSEEFGGLYNRNFVTTSEFSKILGELYNNGYVLVNFDSFTTNSNGTILPKNISLPEGKKPIMLTETMVNYFEYMTDHNKDGIQNDGDGFANKLVVDENGDIKAEYVDSNGTTMVGDYDFVPILETFLKEHPDFSYRGAKAILAVTGSEGIFGYRINSSFVASRGASYQEEQIAGATTLVNALRQKGYTLACFTYANQDYSKWNTNQITQDLDQWNQQITPVIGNVDILVYAREADISDYTGATFTAMSNKGFRYFVGRSTTGPSTEVNTTYVHQKRLMVTGNSLAWNQSLFTNIFDPNSVIDMTTRGNVPN